MDAKYIVTIVETGTQVKTTIRIKSDLISSDREIIGQAVNKRWGKNAFFQLNTDLTGNGSRFYGQVMRHTSKFLNAYALTGNVYADVMFIGDEYGR